MTIATTPWDKVAMKSNMLKWGQWWLCQPMSGQHPPKPHCQPIKVKTKMSAMKEHGSIHVNMKSCILDAKASHIVSWELIFSSPWCNKKGGFPWGPKVKHKCNMTNQGFNGGGRPTKCVTQWKKCLKSIGKNGSLHKQIIMHSHFAMHKISSALNAN